MALAGTVLLALLIFILPGFSLAWVSGAKVPTALAAGLPVTFGVISLASLMWGATSAPFNWLTFSITLFLALVVAAAWRWGFVRRERARTGASWRSALWPEGWRAHSALDPSWIIPALGVVAGSWIIVSDRMNWLVRMPHGLDSFVQGWDSQWHANVVRYIMTEHVASPIRMGELHNMETHAAMLYPSGYHAGVALFAEAAGLDPIPALHIATAILPGVALPISMACLVLTMLRSRGLTAQIAAVLAAIGIYVAPPVLWIGDYVGFWPYLFAACMVGSVIYLFCSVPFRHELLYPAALALVGVLGVHPSSVTYVALAVALFWLTSLLVRPARSRLSDLVWLAATVIVAALLFLPEVIAGSSVAGEVVSWATPGDAVFTDPWNTILTLSTRHVQEFFPAFSATTLLWLGGFGALAALLWRGQPWSILYYAISAAVAVNVLKPFGGWFGDTLGILGHPHYNTAHRLIMPVAMVTVAAAAIGVAAMVRLLCLAPLAARNGTPAWARASVVASTVVAVAAACGTAWWVQDRVGEGAEASYTDPRADGPRVDENDRLAFDWLGTQPAAWEGYTMGDSADGYSWLYAYNGVPTIARHYMWPVGGRGSSTDTLFWHSDMLGAGVRGDENAENIADRAAKDLDVKFIISSPDPFWWQQDPSFEQIKGLWTAPGSTPVYRKGKTVIFAVNEQFTPAELRAMRNDAEEHGSDYLPELQAVSGASRAQGENLG
ncbi:DUF6541 family protein [Corynebacterium sp. UBA2622]|uniref:DUF6541 family protein n=1 Tax=Corynebacterium sp. UBA2622 TaxID=1946393 RepID=UPI0025B7E42C|nr:DUF6541 family protein [Corynebacterium sp. UBA2622]